MQAGEHGDVQRRLFQRTGRPGHDQPVLVGGDAGAGGREDVTGDRQRREVAVVEQHPIVLRGVDHDGVAVPPRQVGGEVPVPQELAVHPGEGGGAGRERGVELRGGPARPAGLVHLGRDAEPVERPQRPAVRVLPLPPEAEDERHLVVRLEFPQDVARAESAADPEDHRLGELRAAVREDICDPRGLGVHAATQPVPVVDGGRRVLRADDVAARRRVALPGARHALPDAGLQVLALGHAISSARPAAGPTLRAPTARETGMDTALPRTQSPLPPRAGPRGDPIRRCGVGGAVAQATTPSGRLRAAVRRGVPLWLVAPRCRSG